MNSEDIPARDWLPKLTEYREPNFLRSTFELTISGVSFVVFCAAAWWALSISYWLTLALCVPAAGFLLRLFLIQHDCGHGAFFRQKAFNDWVGRIIGVFSLTPYHVWRRSHSLHHATSGHLDKRGMGDIEVLTVKEYLALPEWRRFLYRLYRHPFILFVIGPAYNFYLRNRLPFGFMRAGWRFWVSAIGTDIALAVLIVTIIYAVGVGPFLLVYVPITLLATSIGVWLFYVQHQFEDTYWAREPSWDLHNASLYGSTYYDLPGVLRWFTSNIGIHHVHHLNSRIPYYRLPQVLRDHPELAAVKRLTLLESFACARLQLWDENRRKLISFSNIQD